MLRRQASALAEFRARTTVNVRRPEDEDHDSETGQITVSIAHLVANQPTRKPDEGIFHLARA